MGGAMTIDDARASLAAWGDWQRSVDAQWHGYPRCAPFTRAGSNIELTGPAVSRPPDDVARVEGVLCQIKVAAVLLYRALEQEYLHQTSQEESAQRCRCSIATFKTRRQAGESWVAGALSVRAGSVRGLVC